MIIEDIVRLCGEQSVRWTGHILARMFQRNIRIEDITAALIGGEIIEQYPSDYPFPSCLVLGLTTAGKSLHVACGSNGAELWLITAYFPNPAEWSVDFKTRKERL